MIGRKQFAFTLATGLSVLLTSFSALAQSAPAGAAGTASTESTASDHTNIHNNLAVGVAAGAVSDGKKTVPTVTAMNANGNWMELRKRGEGLPTIMNSTANISMGFAQRSLQSNGLITFSAGYRTGDTHGNSTALYAAPLIRLDMNMNPLQKTAAGGTLGVEAGAVLINHPKSQQLATASAFTAKGQTTFQYIEGPFPTLTLKSSEKGGRANFAFGKTGLVSMDYVAKDFTGTANLHESLFRAFANIPYKENGSFLVGISHRSDKPNDEQDSHFIPGSHTNVGYFGYNLLIH